MTAGSKRVPIDHTDRRVEVRVDVCMSGNFALANKRDAKGERRKFACRATNISQSAIVLLTPIAGAIGERVIAYFEEFGELNGAISRIFVGGFVMRVVSNDKDRAKFREKLLWLQASKNLKVFDRRTYKRIIPEEPRSTLLLADGRILECFVIDMSASGVAVSADIVPRVGAPLAVGKVVGKIVRHFEDGFAVRFKEIQDLAGLERMIIHDWADEVAGPMPLFAIRDHALDR